jgi:hypothetical protein
MSHEPSTFEIADRHTKWLAEMADKHGLPDEHKTLRVILDFAMQDGDEDEIFVEIRCNDC